MDETKNPLASKAVWGGVVALVAGITGAVTHYAISPADQATITNDIVWFIGVASQAGAVVGGLVAIYGRLVASKKIAVK